VQLLPEGPQQHKTFLEAMLLLKVLLPGLLGWLL
jgi:hypothetical protein